MSRLIIRWTDPNERVHNWPFVSNGREVASVEVDGVEYVEIVRCSDCEHYSEYVGSCIRPRVHFSATPDDFCSWGERRDA